jgi:hypothetical protein
LMSGLATLAGNVPLFSSIHRRKSAIFFRHVGPLLRPRSSVNGVPSTVPGNRMAPRLSPDGCNRGARQTSNLDWKWLKLQEISLVPGGE